MKSLALTAKIGLILGTLLCVLGIIVRAAAGGKPTPDPLGGPLPLSEQIAQPAIGIGIVMLVMGVASGIVWLIGKLGGRVARKPYPIEPGPDAPDGPTT